MLKTVMMVAALLSPSANVAESQSVQDIVFDRTILDWHFFDADGDGRNDFLVFLEDDKGPMYSIVRQKEDGSFAKGAPGTLPHDTVAMALGSFVSGRARNIALVSPRGVSLLVVTDSGIELREEILDVQSLFRAPTSGPPALWHWPTDVDKDGHDDLILPTDTGISVYFGDSGGGFSDHANIPVGGDRILEEAATGTFSFVRSYPRPVFEDILGDHRMEMAWFDETGLVVIPQGDQRKFEPGKPTRFALPWIAGKEATGLLEQTDISFESIADDKKASLVLTKMRAQDGSITNMRTTLIILGNTHADPPFPRNPTAALRLKGVVGVGPHFADVDGDAVPDLITGTYAAGLSDALSRLLKKVPITLHMYRGGKDPVGSFSTTPECTLKLSISSDDFESWGARNSISLKNDFTGDGVCDLFHMSGRGGDRKARIRAGVVRDGEFSVADDAIAETPAHDITGVSFRTTRDNGPASVIFRTGKSLRIWSLHP